MFSPVQTRQNGSVMVYILVAVSLLAALSVAMTRQSSQNSMHDISDEQAAFLVNEILQTSSAARSAIDNIQLAGSQIDSLLFTAPNEGGYNDDSIHNVYHPSGGGLEYRKTFSKNACVNDSEANGCGIFITRHTHMEGTPTGADDVFLYIHHLKENVCKMLNRRLTGSEDIPSVSATLDSIFIDGTNDLTLSRCEDCEEKSALCVQGSGDIYGFYSLLAPQ